MSASTRIWRILGVDRMDVLTDAGGGTVTVTEARFVNQVSFNSDIGNVDFQGSQEQERVYVDNGFSVEATLDKYDLKAITTAFGKSVVNSPGLGVAKRVYFGESAQTAGVSVGVRCTVSAVDEATGDTKSLRIEVPRSTLTVIEPPNLAYNGKGQARMRFSAEKVSTDIAGNALPSVPPGGCRWFMDELS